MVLPSQWGWELNWILASFPAWADSGYTRLTHLCQALLEGNAHQPRWRCRLWQEGGRS